MLYAYNALVRFGGCYTSVVVVVVVVDNVQRRELLNIYGPYSYIRVIIMMIKVHGNVSSINLHNYYLRPQTYRNAQIINKTTHAKAKEDKNKNRSGDENESPRSDYDRHAHVYSLNFMELKSVSVILDVL